MDDLDRFLDLVRRELGSDDARFEYGGCDGDPGQRMESGMPGGWRVVAIFDSPLPSDRASKQAKLDSLVESFAGMSKQLEARLPRTASAIAAEELDYVLGVLAEKTKALRALVLDED
jgi:hypothetical protein